MAEVQKKQIFRSQAQERISAPEQLNDYLRVTNVGIWVLLTIAILLLGAFFAWASLGTLETKATAKASVKEGTAQIVVMENAEIKAGMTVRMGNTEFRVANVEKDEMGFTVAYAPANLPDGNYDAEIVVETVSPISFLLTM